MMETGPADVWTVCFSPDDKFVISGSHAGKIHMYSVETRKQERTLDTRGKFTLSIAYVSLFTFKELSTFTIFRVSLNRLFPNSIP